MWNVSVMLTNLVGVWVECITLSPICEHGGPYQSPKRSRDTPKRTDFPFVYSNHGTAVSTVFDHLLGMIDSRRQSPTRFLLLDAEEVAQSKISRNPGNHVNSPAIYPSSSMKSNMGLTISLVFGIPPPPLPPPPPPPHSTPSFKYGQMAHHFTRGMSYWNLSSSGLNWN